MHGAALLRNIFRIYTNFETCEEFLRVRAFMYFRHRRLKKIARCNCLITLMIQLALACN